MKILVYGAGAVGGYLAGRLSQQGHDTAVIVRDITASIIKENGLAITENGLIKIRAAVKIDFEAIPDAKDMNILHNIMVISYKNVGDESYYPYKFLDQYITVVPSNMKAYTSAALDDEEYEYIKNKLNKSRNPSAYIELKPSVTDHEAPHNIDGLDQWIMTADIVSYLIIDDSGSIIWEKTAPWYIAPQTRDLNNLYDGQYRVNKPE